MIVHDASGKRFTSDVDGFQSVLDYRLEESIMTITHTGVPAQVAGRGIAGELMRSALATARAAGWKVRPSCSYAIAFMAKHPEFEDLRSN